MAFDLESGSKVHNMYDLNIEIINYTSLFSQQLTNIPGHACAHLIYLILSFGLFQIEEME